MAGCLSDFGCRPFEKDRSIYLLCLTRKAYQHEGWQAKSVAHQTDYDEPQAKERLSGCAVLLRWRPIG